MSGNLDFVGAGKLAGLVVFLIGVVIYLFVDIWSGAGLMAVGVLVMLAFFLKKGHRSGARSHKGQVAILIFLIFLAVVAAVFWNWNSIQSMNWSILSLPENPSLQIILILVAMIVILFAYMAYKAKEPSIMRGN